MRKEMSHGILLDSAENNIYSVIIMHTLNINLNDNITRLG